MGAVGFTALCAEKHVVLVQYANIQVARWPRLFQRERENVWINLAVCIERLERVIVNGKNLHLQGHKTAETELERHQTPQKTR